MKDNLDKESVMKQISALVKDYFPTSKNFVPGKTKISLAPEPPYDSEEIIEAIDSLISTNVTMGKKVQEFEKEFANYIGVKHAVMVNSGSSANLLSLSILTNPQLKERFKPGDEIITPALSWVTTVYPIVNNGLKPVLVDVDPGTFNINPNNIEEAITEKTKGIFPIHVIGNPAEMDKIKNIAEKHKLVLIEDCCEAHGAECNQKKVGSFGDMSTFSFYLSHHMTTIEGGMLLTNNEEYYELGKALRAFGWIRDLKNKSELASRFSNIDSRFLFVNLGFNIRPTELQGSFGICQLKKLDDFIRIRRHNLDFWNKILAKYSEYIQIPQEKPNCSSVSFGYSILVKDNAPFTLKQLMDFLESKKIETRTIMSGNIVNQPVSKYIDCRISGSLTNSDKIMKNALWFANHHRIGTPEREYIAKSISEFIDNKMRK